MSAALQLPFVWAVEEVWSPRPGAVEPDRKGPAEEPASDPPICLAFYRKHTERVLRRYLYASTQVGRAPSVLSEPVARGWASSRPVHSFEDAAIFVLDVERCLDCLGQVDRALLSRIVLQEYTQAEAAALLGMSARAVSYKFPLALDRLTQKLMELGVLILPKDS